MEGGPFAVPLRASAEHIVHSQWKLEKQMCAVREHKRQSGRPRFHTFHIRNDRVQPARAGRLRPDQLGDLQLPLGVDGPDGDLVLAAFRRPPLVVPDDP